MKKKLLTLVFVAVFICCSAQNESNSLKAYSKYDFIPGEKIIGFEDLSTGNIGDFPAGWNTNAAGEIVTIEGVARGGRLHPLQRAFVESAALQCGFCTPGLILAAKALLDQDPDPSEDRIRMYLANNLCRCTGYDKIIRAVTNAAAELREVNV